MRCEAVGKLMSRERVGFAQRARHLSGWALLMACLLGATTAHAGLGTAVEYYNAKINHYFITAYPEEAAALDAGTNVKGWTRTGGQFTVFTEPAEGLQAVCRFFGTPNVGPNSHFYTADADECAKVKTYPGVDVRGDRVLHPDAERTGAAAATGRCTAATTRTRSRTRTTGSRWT